MEVLVSMFIILFGLLGVAALLEVGRSEMGTATRTDRALACGRSGLAEVRIRRMNDPSQWLAWYDNNNPYPNWFQRNAVQNFTVGWYSPTTVVRDPTTGAITQEYEQYLQHYQAYVIDPLYIARFFSDNPGATAADVVFNVARFPYGNTATLCMARCSFGAAGVGNLALFDRMFTWPDDQVFNIPRALDQRPSQQVDTTGISQSEGNYSWLATVCPVPAEAGQPVADRSAYEVSVVVFYQRDFSPPSLPADPDKPAERVVAVGMGGGGDVVLSADSSGPNAKAIAYMDVRENDWILLGAVVSGRDVFKWYRVAVVGGDTTNDTNVTPNQWRRPVTLDGPDWTYGPPAVGVLVTGVAGVYTAPMSTSQ